MKLYYLVPFFLFILLTTACSSNEPEAISKRQLRSLMIESINHAAESWWYLGSDKISHYILVERPGNARLYTVLNNEVTVKLETYQYIANKAKRSKLKLSKIKLVK